MITNTDGTITFYARTLLDDGTESVLEPYVLVPGESIMTMVEYQCWLTSRLLKTHPGRISVNLH